MSKRILNKETFPAKIYVTQQDDGGVRYYLTYDKMEDLDPRNQVEKGEPPEIEVGVYVLEDVKLAVIKVTLE